MNGPKTHIFRWLAAGSGTVPALPGVVTEGDTHEEVRAMAKDAIRLDIESLIQEGRPIPTDVELKNEPVKEKVTVALPAA